MFSITVQYCILCNPVLQCSNNNNNFCILGKSLCTRWLNVPQMCSCLRPTDQCLFSGINVRSDIYSIAPFSELMKLQRCGKRRDLRCVLTAADCGVSWKLEAQRGREGEREGIHIPHPRQNTMLETLRAATHHLPLQPTGPNRLRAGSVHVSAQAWSVFGSAWQRGSECPRTCRTFFRTSLTNDSHFRSLNIKWDCERALRIERQWQWSTYGVAACNL